MGGKIHVDMQAHTADVQLSFRYNHPLSFQEADGGGRYLFTHHVRHQNAAQRLRADELFSSGQPGCQWALCEWLLLLLQHNGTPLPGQLA